MSLKNILISFLFFITAPAFATVSPVRHAHENFTQARVRNSILVQQTQDLGIQSTSAWAMADSFENMDFSKISDVGSMEKLNQIFEYVRDSKFVTHQPTPLTDRRLSWLFPDDGCYTRAELAAYFTSKQSMPETFKFFGFGNLAVKSPNHPDGVVRWWYHVVPIYRVGQQAYVLDPSIEPTRPLTAEEWKKSMETDAPAEKFAICNTHTLGPEDNCTNPRPQSFDSLIRSQEDFLEQEWSRIEDLGRNPESELGDAPPWKR